jgi:hypothetical protein
MNTLEKLRAILKKLKTAWQSKAIAGALSVIGVILATSYGLDIQPVIEAVEKFWLALSILVGGLGVTAIGDDKDD